MTRSDFGTMQE